MLKYLAKGILFLLGWKTGFQEESLRKILEPQSVVGVYPHTSYLDFFFCMLYLFTAPDFQKKAKILINPKVMKKFSWLLKRLGCVSSSPIEDRNAGLTQEIIENLKKEETFVFLISPKGTIKKSEWRTGWFHILKGTESRLMVCGPDYLDHEMKVFFAECTDDIRKQEIIVKNLMSQITPKYPENSEIPLKKGLGETGILSFEREMVYLALTMTSLLIVLSIIH